MGFRVNSWGWLTELLADVEKAKYFKSFIWITTILSALLSIEIMTGLLTSWNATSISLATRLGEIYCFFTLWKKANRAGKKLSRK